MKTFNQIARKYFSSDSKIPLYDQMCAIQKAQYDASNSFIKRMTVSIQGKMLKDLFGKDNTSPSIYAYQEMHKDNDNCEKELPAIESPDKSDDKVYSETKQIFTHMEKSNKFPNNIWHAQYNKAIAKCKKDKTVPQDSRLIKVYETVTGETVENA